MLNKLATVFVCTLLISCSSQREVTESPREETFETLSLEFSSGAPGKFEALTEEQLNQQGLKDSDFMFILPSNFTYTLDERVQVGHKNRLKYFRQDLRSHTSSASRYSLSVESRTNSSVRERYELLGQITGMNSSYSLVGVDNLTVKNRESGEIDYDTVSYEYSGSTENEVKRLKSTVVKCRIEGVYNSKNQSFGYYILPSGQKVKALSANSEKIGAVVCEDGKRFANGKQKISYIETIELSDLDTPLASTSTVLYYYSEVFAGSDLVYRSKTERWE